MKVRFIGLLAVLIWFGTADGYRQASFAPEVRPKVVYVLFDRSDLAPGPGKSGLPIFDAAAARFGVTSIEKAFPFLDAAAESRTLVSSMDALRRTYLVTYTADESPHEVAKALAGDPGVVLAEAVPMYRPHDLAPAADPNDPRYSDQVHLRRLNLPAAWDVVKAEQGTAFIAVVDTGFEMSHPDLIDNIWTNPGEIPDNGLDDDGNGFVDDLHGWNFSRDSNNPDHGSNAFNDHGTKVAGAAAAVTDNGAGIAGSSWNARFLPISVRCTDSGFLCFATQGVTYAALMGARIINASFGGPHFSEIDRLAFQAAEDAGALVVASAGNDAVNTDMLPTYPATFRTVLSVGATRKNSDANLYNYGRGINVWAAGGSVDVTAPGQGYSTAWGTSFAAPLVSGVAALVATAYANYSPAAIREQIRLTAESIDGAQPVSEAGLYGRGLVNAYRAVTEDAGPGVRLIDYTARNQDELDAFVGGDRVTVTATFKNFLGNAPDVSIELRSDADYVDGTPQPVALGPLASGAEATVDLDIRLDTNSPDNAVAVLYPRITAGSLVDTPDIMRLPINQNAAAHHRTRALTASITAEGNIGFTAFPNEVGTQGLGFRVIDANGDMRNVLFEGSLMVANGPGRVSDGMRGSAAGAPQDEDFAIKDDTALEIVAPGQHTSEYGRVNLTDLPAANPLGIDILQESFVDDTPEHEDILILKYTITNTSSGVLTNLHVGLVFDWDVAPTASDYAGFDAARGAGYVTDQSAWVGVRKLDSSAPLHYQQIQNDPYLYDGYTEVEKWRHLSSGVNEWTVTTPEDFSQAIASGPHMLEPAAQATVAFVVAGGSSETDFLANTDVAQILWDTRLSDEATSIEPVAPVAGWTLDSVYPNPSRGPINFAIEAPTRSEVHLAIYDLLGREVDVVTDTRLAPGVHRIQWPARRIPSGVYVARAVVRSAHAERVLTQPVVIVR